jgi:hypothetical protein
VARWSAFVFGVVVAAVGLAALALAFAAAPARSTDACLGGASSIEATIVDGVVRESAPAVSGCTP